MYMFYSWRTTLTSLLLATFTVGFAFFLSASPTQAQVDSQFVHNFASSQNIEVTSMSLSAVGEIFIAGIFLGTVDFDPGPGETLLSGGPKDTSFIAKYDPNGNLVWAYRLGGSANVHINDIVVDSMAQIGVVGSFKDTVDLDPGPGVYQVTSNGKEDIFLLRLLPDGNLQWAWADGDEDNDAGYAVATDSRSALYITGKFQGDISFQSGSSPTYGWSSVGGSDVFAMRFNNAGTLFWVRVFGGDEDDSGTDLDLDGADNVFVVGTFEGEIDLDPLWTSLEVRSRGRKDIFVSVMNVYGDSRWQTAMGSEGSESNAQILVESDASFYLSGEFERTGDFDRLGDGGNVESHGGQDIFIARYSPSRAFQWAYGIGGAQHDTLAGLAQDSFGNLYVLGNYAGTVDFDLREGTTELTSSGAADIFLAKYTQQGELRRVQGMINPQDDRARALAISATNNVLLAGEYSGTLDFGNGLSTSTGQPDGVYNAFVAHYARDTWIPLPLRAFLPGIKASPATE